MRLYKCHHLGSIIITSLLKVVTLLGLLRKRKRLGIVIKIGLKLDPIWDRHLKYGVHRWMGKLHKSACIEIRSSSPIISGVTTYSGKFIRGPYLLTTEDSAMECKNPDQGGKNPVPLATRHYGFEHGLWIC